MELTFNQQEKTEETEPKGEGKKEIRSCVSDINVCDVFHWAEVEMSRGQIDIHLEFRDVWAGDRNLGVVCIWKYFQPQEQMSSPRQRLHVGKESWY